MSLIFIGGPTILNGGGGNIMSIRNDKTALSQGMDWGFEQLDGWYQSSRKYTNALIVTTNNPYVGPIQIQKAVLGIGALQGSYYQFPLPELVNGAVTQVGPYEQDLGSFCQTVGIRQTAEDGMQWLVTLGYGPTNINHNFGSSETANGAINPLESAPTVHWSGVIYEVTYPQDANGVPFLNTVGDPLENPPPVEEARQSLHFTRNEATYDDNYAQSYRMTLNSDPFLGFQPLQAKCKNIDGERIYSQDFGYFWRVSYEFEFRIAYFTSSSGDVTTYGFQELILNAGLRQNVSNAPAQILVNGIPITNPVALTQAGTQLNASWTVGSSSNQQPYYLVFQNYPTSIFANLNIPQNILTASS